MLWLSPTNESFLYHSINSFLMRDYPLLLYIISGCSWYEHRGGAKYIYLKLLIEIYLHIYPIIICIQCKCKLNGTKFPSITAWMLGPNITAHDKQFDNNEKQCIAIWFELYSFLPCKALLKYLINEKQIYLLSVERYRDT